MISDDLKQIVELLKTQGSMDFLDGKGATEEQILQFEENNKIKLPSKYKEWLLFCDGGECFLPAGVQFYGIIHKPIIDTNDNDKPNDNYIIIGALATGDPILCEKDSERISIFNREAEKIESDEIYPNFFDFLNDLYKLLGMGD